MTRGLSAFPHDNGEVTGGQEEGEQMKRSGWWNKNQVDMEKCDPVSSPLWGTAHTWDRG